MYTMSAGDLGLDPSGIEDSLTRILELAAKWNAAILQDEADVFLDARNTSDLERNKRVWIFLRMLEHHQGMLFRTTNRVKQIDDACHSRSNVSLHYPFSECVWQTSDLERFCWTSKGTRTGRPSQDGAK